MAIKEKVKYLGSTSSVSESLSHLYFLFSRFRPINTETLTAAARAQVRATTSKVLTYRLVDL